MPFAVCPPKQIRILLRVLADDEKGSPHIVSLQYIQDAVRETWCRTVIERKGHFSAGLGAS